MRSTNILSTRTHGVRQDHLARSPIDWHACAISSRAHMTPTHLRVLAVATLAGSLSLACSAPSDDTEAPPPPVEAVAPAAEAAAAVWMVTEAMHAPESAFLDEESDALFVSLIDGDPGERDGTGHIARLTRDGEVVDATWVTGLNAPKGLRAHDGTLWVADLDEVIAIDIESAEITSRLTVEGAVFLNDVATGPDGTVYVSDTNGYRIFAIKDGSASVFAEGEVVESPNGLLVDGGRLLVGSMQQGADPESAPGRLFALDLTTGEKTILSSEPVGTIDGIELDGRGGYILTNVFEGQLVHVSPTGDVRVLLNFGDDVAADHAYDREHERVIVPHLFQNKVGAYDVSGLLNE